MALHALAATPLTEADISRRVRRARSPVIASLPYIQGFRPYLEIYSGGKSITISTSPKLNIGPLSNLWTE